MSEPEQHKRLVGLRFVESVSFAGDELPSATLKSHSERGQVDSFTFIRFEADGRAVPLGPNQAAQGIALERNYLDRATNKPRHERAVIGLVAVRQYFYGPAEAKTDAK